MLSRPSETALLFHLSGLGDTLFFLPALAAWRRARPGLRVTALTMFPAVRDLLRHSPLVDEVIHREYERDFFGGSKLASLRFFAGLRTRRFGCGIVPYGSNRLEYNVANFLAVGGEGVRLGHRYRKHPLRNFDFLNTLHVPQRSDLHAVEANVELLVSAGLIGADAATAWPAEALHIPEAARERAEVLLSVSGRPFAGGHRHRLLVGVHAGSNAIKNQANKCYPPLLLAEALRAVAAVRPEVFFLLFEGEADRERTEAVAGALPEGLYRRVRPADILECAACLDGCAAFVANDSGLLHLAAFRGLPCVGIFGPTSAVYARPWGVPHRVVSAGLPCQPCFEFSSRPLACVAGIDFACVRHALPPARVAAALGELAREVGF